MTVSLKSVNQVWFRDYFCSGKWGEFGSDWAFGLMPGSRKARDFGLSYANEDRHDHQEKRDFFNEETQEWYDQKLSAIPKFRQS